jgi:hypothetical protein
MLVVCADIGSVPKGNFAWWSNACNEGTSPESLSATVASALLTGQSVALGFECPLFVPIPERELDLGKSRIGEGNRAWAAGAGAGALATGLVQVAWVLQRIRVRVPETISGCLSWSNFLESQPSLLIWEAFVSGSAKGTTHVADARRAVNAFAKSLPDPRAASAISVAGSTYSLAGAALLRTGWSTDITLLQQACIVIRADKGEK